MKRFVASALVALLVMILAGSVFAEVQKVPSIEAKVAPKIVVAPELKDTPEYVTVIYDAKENQIEKIPTTRLIVTPLAEVKETPYEDVRESLIKADNDLKTADSLSKLCEQLDDVAKTIDPNYTADDFVVSNLFDVTLLSDNDTSLELEDGQHATVTIDLGIQDTDETPVILQMSDEGVWSVMDPELIVRNEDNTLTIKFYELGTMATLLSARAYAVLYPQVTSPQTGFDVVPYATAAVVVVVASAVMIIVLLETKKRKA